jgi:hypothetical protein
MLLDPLTPFAAAVADGEAPVPTPDQIAGMDMTILVTWLRIRGERGHWAWQTRQLKRLNAVMKTLWGVQGALGTRQ